MKKISKSKKSNLKDKNTKETDSNIQNASETENAEENAEQSKASSSEVESAVETSFFYTNDKFINSFDNEEITDAIQRKYKNLNVQNADSVIKKEIVHFLEDDKFVEYILNFYNISVFDLFKLIYKQYGSIFKGPYLKKIRKTISGKKYARNERRKTDY